MLWPVVGWVPVVESTLDSELTHFPVDVQIPVQILGEWCRHVSILPPVTLYVALVVGVGMAVAMAAYVSLIGFPAPKSEITATTNEQKLSSLVSLSEPHTTAL